MLDLEPPQWKTREQQRRSLDLLADINRRHAERRPSHDELAARMESYELAYRMQAEVPDIVDLSRESEATRDAYGLNAEASRSFGRQCLLARRLVEQGVRFVQIFSGGWDSHDFLERNHAARIESVDKPIAALIRDLRQRGMLDETLVVCSGEFGRTPDNNRRGGVDPNGRGHNADAMAVLMAGGGTPAGTVVGATDEVGNRAVEVVHPFEGPARDLAAADGPGRQPPHLLSRRALQATLPSGRPAHPRADRLTPAAPQGPWPVSRKKAFHVTASP